MTVEILIDGEKVCAREDSTVLQAALGSGVYIPHLCHHPDLPSFEDAAPVDVCYRGEGMYRSCSPDGSYEGCGLCVVEVQGERDLLLSCVTKVAAGMEVVTSTPSIETLRQERLASMLARHPHACLVCAQRQGCSLTQCSTDVPEAERCCPQFNSCELQKVAEYVGIRADLPRYIPRGLHIEEGDPLFIRDYNLCIGCLRCVRVCKEIIGAEALGYILDGVEVVVGTRRPDLGESACRFCGACVEVCPTGALRDEEQLAGDRKSALVPCAASCPVGMEIPAYVSCVARGEYEEAARIIRGTVPMALSLGYICHHPCEDVCRRRALDEPVAICDLKRSALQMAKSKPEDLRKGESGKRVVVIGSGPTGLVAACFLAKAGHSVTVYEGEPEPGGMLRWAIPEFRYPHSILSRQIEEIRAVGVEIVTDTPIERTDLVRDSVLTGCDALLVAVGAQESKRVDVAGLTLAGVSWGLEFLREVKKGSSTALKGKVVVIGGGNVAMDVAMTALRLGASGVEVACLECKEDMPAFPSEILRAEEEGVVIHPGWGPEKIRGQGGAVSSVELLRCTSVLDEEGDFHPTFDQSERMSLDADAVILAVGQKPDLSCLPPDCDVETTNEGTIKVNQKTLATSVRGVFAAGEVTTGPASAVEAMAMGKRAASSIDRFLGGQGIADSRPVPEVVDTGDLWLGREEDFSSKERIPVRCLSVDDRGRSFDLIELGFDEDEAVEEASRCLRCDVRLRLSPVTLPPEKWLEFNPEAISRAPESEGAFQLLDEERNVIYIAGSPNLRQALREQLATSLEARYFTYDEDPMYTKRESELLQQFLQTHGHLPAGNEEVDDLF
jgi:formate dehydrogenase beta subunit